MESNVITYKFADCTLYFELGIPSAPPPANNLYLINNEGNRIWEMGKFCHPDDSAVLVREIDENTFYFATFFGLYYIIDVPSFEVKEKGITK